MPLAFFEVCDFATHYAALLALEPDHNLTCDYVGRRDLPKNSGTVHAYLLRRGL